MRQTTITRWGVVGALLALLLCSSTAAVAQAGAATSGVPAQTVAATPAGTPGAIDSRVEGVIKAVTLYLARFVEAAAALVIGIASVRALAAYFVNVASRGQGQAIPKEEIRLSLGRSLALALEFELGADILKTAVAPTWNDIGLLASIAVLRTALNYFLERELRNAEQRGAAVGPAADNAAARQGT